MPDKPPMIAWSPIVIWPARLAAFAMINELKAVDTEGVTPMAHAQDVVLPLRPDKVTETDRHALYQSVAPAVEDGLYLVPKVIE